MGNPAVEKLNFATLCLEIGYLPTVRLSCSLDQFISTFNYRNHSVKFEDLKLSTKKLLAHYFETYSNRSDRMEECHTYLDPRVVEGGWKQKTASWKKKKSPITTGMQ